MVEAVVEHDYDAQEPDELTLKKGDIICNIIVKPGGWWEGTLQKLGKRGMFPDNFVKVLGGGEKKSSDSSQGQSNNKLVPGRKCKVLFSYTASVEDELDLNVGDIIDISGEVEEGWWRGKLKNRVGVFPSNFVTLISDNNENSSATDSLKKSKLIDESAKFISEEIKDASSVNMSKSKENISSESSENLPALPPKPTKEMCRVLYQYKAANEDELTLEEGDVITIITKDVQDPGWWKGELKGKIGVFPDNFVKIITPLDEVKPDRPTKITKSKDAITKSSSSASVYSSSSSIAVSRKFSDSIRPTVSVKPQLPPPTLKKPTLSPVEGKQASRLSTGDITETISSTKPSLIKQQEQEKAKHSEIPVSANRGSIVNSISSSNVSQKQGSGGASETKWTVLESNDAADGMSWSRQSYSVTSSSSSNVISSSSTVTSSSLMTSSSTNSSAIGATGENLDLDMVSRSAMLTHPTASRAKVPKRRLPSSLLSREDSRESDGGETMVNGNVEPSPPVQEKQASSKQPPWVEELKLNQAKKSQGGGKTSRVLISSSESGISSSHSTSSSSMSNTSEISRVALRQIPITAQRPLSLQPGSTHRLSGGDHQSPDSTITITLLQWNQLCDKVSKLESDLEDQSKEFGKTIKELVETIEQQNQKQKKMMSDLERLRDIVTQV